MENDHSNNTGITYRRVAGVSEGCSYLSEGFVMVEGGGGGVECSERRRCELLGGLENPEI